MIKNKIVFIIIGIILLLLISIAYAHEAGEENHKGSMGSVENLKAGPIRGILIASVISLVFLVISLIIKTENEKIKWLLFLGITAPVLAATIYLTFSTIYLNIISETKGPVHWHADYEIWICDKKVELIKPKGLSNKIGSPLLHEHGDNRIHIEGVVTDTKKFNLHSFFETFGGDLNKEKLIVPTDNGVITVENGKLCNGKEGKLQMFLYKVKNPDDEKNWIFRQEKIKNFPEYVPSPYSNIPPGDCIIIEFDVEKEKTEHICETYKTAMKGGRLSGS